MSGFVGLVMSDGAPVDRELLEQMTHSLAFRGPDGQGLWAEGSVGLGHTLLRTTDQSEHERQPATLDGQVWIAADARIDGREDLARELGLNLEVLASPDCDLILHAYARWGDRCVEHLIGDFAFAIWDARARTLFAARDHFGIKPFYYAHVRGGLVVGNTLNAVRLHPGVSDRLNELAVADYLLFEFNQDFATTTFADVQRLPPAHALTWRAGQVSVRRYWSLPCDEVIRYRRVRDYVERFGDLFERAVRDRVRSSRASVFFSGGLDSTSVAGTVRRISPATELRAYTVVYESLVPDDEGRYAGIAARHLGIPLEIISADDFELYEHREVYATPEPNNEPLRSLALSLYGRAARHAPVALTGQGADPIFMLPRTLSGQTLRATPIRQAAAVFIDYMADQRRIPRFHLRGTLRSLLGLGRTSPPPFPPYLDRGLVARNGLEQRFARLRQGGDSRQWRRPAAAQVVAAPFWAHYFETSDPGWTRCSVEEWHPFFSLPLVCYMMSTSELPFCVDKYLLRAHASGLIPEQVRRRPKTPLRTDPVAVQLRRWYRRGAGVCALTNRRLAEFVDLTAVAALLPNGGEGDYARSRVFDFNLWLDSSFQGERQCPTPPIP